MKNHNLILIFTLLISSCNNTQENESLLIGQWSTLSCQEVTDANETPVGRWSKAIYEFTKEGEILGGRNIYSDSDCNVTLNNVPPEVVQGVDVTYQDLGNVSLQEGIEGHGLKISFQSNTHSFTREAFYTFISDELCFSEAFSFDVFNFTVSEAGSSSIDFNKCLVNL